MKNYKTRSLEDEKKDLTLQAPPVSKYMTRELITFRPEDEISKVIESMLKNRITGAPVLNARKELVGMIDDRSCLKVLIGGAYYNHPVEKSTVAAYMYQDRKSVSMNDSVIDVARIFLDAVYKRLLVLDDAGRLVGQISRRDVLRAIDDMQMSTW
ncbi:MAG: CBS domain-containing protein [Bacteroidota bacterium]